MLARGVPCVLVVLSACGPDDGVARQETATGAVESDFDQERRDCSENVGSNEYQTVMGAAASQTSCAAAIADANRDYERAKAVFEEYCGQQGGYTMYEDSTPPTTCDTELVPGYYFAGRGGNASCCVHTEPRTGIEDVQALTCQDPKVNVGDGVFSAIGGGDSREAAGVALGDDIGERLAVAAAWCAPGEMDYRFTSLPYCFREGTRHHCTASIEWICCAVRQQGPPQLALCDDPSALNYQVGEYCEYDPGPYNPVFVDETCQDPSANNYLTGIGCTYDVDYGAAGGPVTGE